MNYKSILSENEKSELFHLSEMYPLDSFLSDNRNFEEMMIDFVYTSAKIEGNTYDRLDTDNLLRLGITTGGKKYSDAVMLVNLRTGFNHIMSRNDRVSLDYLCDMHKILMKDLLPTSEQGLARNTPVRIGATDYSPPHDIATLKGEIAFIMKESEMYDNPFEKGIYLHCNIAYLQYFRDGNKRTARMMQTAVMVNENVLPLFFSDKLIEQYRKSVVTYYETGDYSLYVDFFKKNYKMAVGNFIGKNLINPEEDIIYTPR